MFNRNRGIVDPRNIALREGSEVRIGAYARRQRRRTIAIAVVGGVLLGAAALLYFRIQPPGRGTPDNTYPVAIQCATCGHQATVPVAFDAVFPIECPNCRRPKALAQWRCRECGESFVPESTDDDVSCPKCGSVAVGSAAVVPPTGGGG